MLVHGKGDNRPRLSLAQGEIALLVAKITARLLKMNWYGIMDLGLYAIGTKILIQIVSILGLHYVCMEHLPHLSFAGRHLDQLAQLRKGLIVGPSVPDASLEGRLQSRHKF